MLTKCSRARLKLPIVFVFNGTPEVHGNTSSGQRTQQALGMFSLLLLTLARVGMLNNLNDFEVLECDSWAAIVFEIIRLARI